MVTWKLEGPMEGPSNGAQKTFQHWAQQYDRNKEQVCRALSELKKIVMYEEFDQN
jgi:hypothetical protein